MHSVNQVKALRMSLCTIPLVRWIHVTVLHAVSEGFTLRLIGIGIVSLSPSLSCSQSRIPVGHLSTAEAVS